MWLRWRSINWLAHVSRRQTNDASWQPKITNIFLCLYLCSQEFPVFLFVRWKIASTMQCDYCCLQRRQLTFIFSPNTHNAQYINSIPTTKPNIWLYSYCLLLYSCPCIFVCIDKRQMSWMQSQSKGSVCIIVARHFQTNFNQNIWFFLSGSNLYFCIWLTSGEGHQWDRVAIEINPSVPGAFLCELIHNSLAVCSFALFSIDGSPRRPCTQRYFAKILVNISINVWIIL